MKHISIVTGSDLRFVMGVNYFIKSFVECNSFFREVKLTRVYSGVQSLNIERGESIPIGSDLRTNEYRKRRSLRSFLKFILNDRFYFLSLFRYELNKYLVSSKSVKRLFQENPSCDCIVFQEIGCADYYYKHIKKYSNAGNVKCMLVIHSEDDSGSMLVEDFKGWGKKDMQRRYDKMRDYVYNRIDKVVYISKKAYDASCLPPSKKTFVYNGVPSLPYDLSYTSKEVVNFVCVGSMEGRKGQNIIVEALHALPKETLKKLHVTFVGGGSEELKLERLVETYDLANVVTFLGKRNDVPDILKTKDVFIMPSTVEGLPMSAIEALRAGLFLILTDTGGNKELCAEGCGYVCERTPQDVMEKILCVINNNIVSTEQKVHNHQRFVEEFSLECMAKNYEKNIVCLMKDSYDRK